MVDLSTNTAKAARILPVLDLKQGVIVRGIAGDRAQYAPVVSRIVPDAQPESVARALIDSFGFTTAYLADLDAIAGEEPSWDTYRRIMDLRMRLILDSGLATTERATNLIGLRAQHPSVEGVVVGLESVPDEHRLTALLDCIGSETAIFSLDLRHGRPITSISSWQARTPIALAEVAVETGFHRLIVLDLAAVGTGQGPVTRTLCAELRSRFPTIELISGGGVRSPADVQTLLEAGCDRVLVASALHDGKFPTIRT